MPVPVLLRVVSLVVSFVVAAALYGGSGVVVAKQAAGPLGGEFLWGVAASGFQSEGSSPDSNWTRYVAARKTPDPYRDSVDFYHRYRDDIRRAQQLGAKVYCLSVEWSRTEPRPGRWNEAGYAFYDSVIRTIRAAGMRPMITLDHWVYPGWEVDRGGWRNPGMAADWLDNARRVVDRYAADDPLWITVNEPMIYAMSEVRMGGLDSAEVPAMTDRIVAVHNEIYDYIHARQPHAMVTTPVAYTSALEPALDISVENRIAAKLDYIGIDYYYGASLANPPTAAGLQDNHTWTLPLEPEGVYYALRYYARRFPGRPLYLVENGMPTNNTRPRADGWTRAADLRDTVYWMQRAKADGMNLIGYNYWSITDSYEWGSYADRFGLYTVDVLTDPTLTRRPTDAVAAYRDITARGGVPADYLPTRAPSSCSLVDASSSCLQPVR